MEKIAKQIITAGQNKDYDELQKIISRIETNKLVQVAVQKIGRADANIFWNFFLSGFSNVEEDYNKKFAVIIAVLNQLNAVEVYAKQSFEIITRLFIELPKLKNDQIVELCQYCMDSLQLSDPKCVGWKDLLPELMAIISTMPKMNVNGIAMSGTEYKDLLIRNIITQKWKPDLLTLIANMFREVKISKEDRLSVVNKLCEPIMKLPPTEIPALAYQVFALSTSASLMVIPLYSFNQYFQRHYYKKAYQGMDSDQSNYGSIENFTDKELCEAQDTVLYHLGNWSEFCITERDIITYFRALSSNPRYILSPFLIGALLTMCKINRDLDSARLSSSATLQFLRSVIRNNERERELCRMSAWCRLALEESVVNMEKVYTILIDQSKEGNDHVTPGVIGLSFILLKTAQNPQLNTMAIKALEQFVKKRYIFGNGIVKKLREFLFADQDAIQFSDCLTRLSKTCTLTLAECVSLFEEIMNFFLLIPGEHAMRMMAFITPLAQISTQIRDSLIEILRKAMYHNDLNTRKLSVFGFCSVLKQLRQNNSRRGSSGLIGTQLTISGYSLLSQSMQDTTRNSQRHFDILVLEIMGILRRSFNQTYEIKEILYDNLIKAADGNLKLTPYIIQFLELHFRAYFQSNDSRMAINFDKIVVEIDEGADVKVNDQLGKLMKCVGHCVLACQQGDMEFDTTSLQQFFNELINRLFLIDSDALKISGPCSGRNYIVATQYLNCLEALMYYIMKGPIGEQPLTKIIDIYKRHAEVTDEMKKKHQQIKKGGKRKANAVTVSQLSRMGTSIGPFNPVNIWSLNDAYRFLFLINGTSDRYPAEQIDRLQSDNAFHEYLLSVTMAKLEEMHQAPSYMQNKYSKSSFSSLCQTTQIVFKMYIRNMIELLAEEKMALVCLSIECFRECLATADFLYKRKFLEFLKLIGSEVVATIQTLVDQLVEESSRERAEMASVLLECLNILYEYIPAEDDEAKMCYNWLIEFCKKNELEMDQLCFIHQLLFTQRVKTQTGVFFEGIAMQIGESLGFIQEEPIDVPFKLKSITTATAPSCVNYLCAALKKEIDHVEYFITKCKSFYVKYKIGGQGEQHGNKCVLLMKTTERKVCSQLINIGRTCKTLANVCLPLGSCMESLIRLLIQLYVCLANLTKHLIIRSALINVSHNQTKFDELVRALGKSLPLKIYGLISYIEQNVFDSNGDVDQNSGQGNKAKVVRETRSIPKLIMRIENFNKFVICLDKKSKSQELSSRLHLGTVRDFRIKTTALKDAINRTFEEAAGDIDEDQLVADAVANDDEEDGEETDDSQPSVAEGTPDVMDE